MLDVTRAEGLTFLLPEKDRTIGGSLKIYGHFAPAEAEIISAYMEQAAPGTLLDLGANIGAICLPLAKQSPDWRIIAVEAHRGLAQVLSANAFANHLYNVDVRQVAIGASEGIAEFPDAPLNTEGNLGTLSIQQMSGHRTFRVLMQTIDQVAPPDTRFIKMDVEGSEPDALQGAEHTLTEVRPVLLIESNPDYEESSRAVNRYLMERGYRLFWFFSPFVTAGVAPKAGWGPPKRNGDYSVLALPPEAPNLWNLKQVQSAEEARPASLSAFPYLKRFGFGQGATTPPPPKNPPE